MNSKDKRNEIITARCTEEEKAMITRKAKAQNKSVSDYIMGCSMAGLERKRDKDRKRIAQIVENQEALNALQKCLEKEESDLDLIRAKELVKQLMKGERRLWDF